MIGAERGFSTYPLPVNSGRAIPVLLVFLAAIGGCAPDLAPRAATPAPEQPGIEQPGPDQPGPEQPGDAAGAAAGGVRYLALGDSLSQGIGVPDMETGAFPALLAQRWRDQGCPVELRNVGVSGYTAAQIVGEQLPAVAEFNPTVVTFQTGGNDIVNGVTLEDYRAGIRQVLDTVRAAGARAVVFTLNEWHRSPEGAGYGGSDAAERSAAYDAVMVEEAAAHDVQIADLRATFRRQADQNLWSEDGLHPAAQAYAEWADELARIVPAPCR